MVGFVDEHSMVICGPWVIGGVVSANDVTHGRPCVQVRKQDGQMVWMPVERLLSESEPYAAYRGYWTSGIGGGPRTT